MVNWREFTVIRKHLLVPKVAGLERVNQDTLTGPKGAVLERVYCNQDTLTGPKGGWIRGSSL